MTARLVKTGAALIRLPDTLLAAIDDLVETRRVRGGGEGVMAFILLAPALIILGLFGIFPMIAAVYMSFFGGKYNNGPFIGFGNYREALGSAGFWNSFAVTCYYAAGVIPLTLLLSFAIAWGIRRLLRARGFFRVIYFLPYITSAVAAAMVWRTLFNTQYGLVNALLAPLGIQPQWLLEPRGVLHLITGGFIPAGWGPSLALCCIIAFDIWHGCGFMVVVFLAGLTAIPRELEEAARIDGASAWQNIRNVVLPLLSPTIFFLGVVSTIRAFQAFNSFYALTGEDRNLGTTENLILHIYSKFYV
jgi:ABC-type sugar transport system permease subunit